MKALRIIFIITVVSFFALKTGFGQNVPVIQDTARLRSMKNATETEKTEQAAKGNAYGLTASPGKSGSSQGVKQIKGGRPDMSKAKGARPPVIVRPSGSGVPKGVGKPGGVVKRGGR